MTFGNLSNIACRKFGACGSRAAEPELAQQAASNSKGQFALGDYPKVFMDSLVDALDGYQGVGEQLLAREGTREV